MNGRIIIGILSTVALTFPAGAQSQRRAVMVGGGNQMQGHCTGEVVVDGAADLQIQGDTASIRDLSGRQPQVQRFECTSALPANVNPRVNVEGRGRAQVVATPANGGPEVIRIEDKEGGASVYRFDISWGAAGAYNQGYNEPYNQGYNNPGYNNNGYEPRVSGRFTQAQALDVCRQSIREQAMENYNARDVDFGAIRMDDNPGRRDWVVGTVGIRRGYRVEQMPFSCSVNFETGRVRSAQINAPAQGYAARDSEARAIDTCRSAVRDRIGNVTTFNSINMDPDGDLVRGSAWSRGRGYEFSCRVSQYSGNVRDVNVWPRR